MDKKEEEYKKAVANSILISVNRKQIYPTPFPPHTLTFAYGEQKYDKILTELNSTDQILKLKVLKELSEDMVDSLLIIKSIKAQLHTALIKLFNEQSVDHRYLATYTVSKMCNCNEGRIALVENVRDFVLLLSDSEEKIRINGYNSLISLSEFRDECEKVVSNNVIEVIIDKLVFEKSKEVMKCILKLLNNLSKSEQSIVRLLKTSVITRLNSHVQSQDKDISFLAVMNLYNISCKYEGKQAIFSEKSIAILCKLINEEHLQWMILKLLASMANKKAGKKELIANGTYKTVIDILAKPFDNKTVLFALQLISVLAEHPEGRKFYLTKLPNIEKLLNTDELIIKSNAETAIKVINWQP